MKRSASAPLLAIAASALALACALAAVPQCLADDAGLTSSAADGEATYSTDDGFGYAEREEGAVILSYRGEGGNVAIPAGIDGLPVIAICDYTFIGCDTLVSVKIPDSVTSIGKGAFMSCDSLSSVEIPSSVTSIGGGAFCDCRSLASINADPRQRYV